MKKLTLIPLLAGASVFALSASTVKESTPKLGSVIDVTMCTITVDLGKGHLKNGNPDVHETSFTVRQGTYWKYAKKDAPKKDDIEYDVYHSLASDDDYTLSLGGEEKIADTYVVKSDITIYPIYDVPASAYVTVNWKNDDNSLIYSEQYVKLETPVYTGEEPTTKLGKTDHTYEFTGWDKEIVPIPDDSPSIIDYVAQFNDTTEIQIVFDLNYNGNKNYTTITYGDTIDEPTDPVRTGFEFKGWFTTIAPIEGTESFDFATHIDDDVLQGAKTFTLYAKWKNDTKMTIIIDPSGGTFKDGSDEPLALEDVTYGTTWATLVAENDIEVTGPDGSKDNTAQPYYLAFDKEYIEITDATEFNQSTYISYDFEYLKANLTFSDPLAGATMPDAMSLDYGTFYEDIKFACEPSDVQEGFTFLNYYMLDGTDRVMVDDDFVFEPTQDGQAYVFYPCYEVTISFDNDISKGVLNNNSVKVKTGETWANYKDQFVPTMVDEDLSFDGMMYDNRGTPYKVPDNFTFTRSETFTVSYVNKAASSFANDSWTTFTNYLNGKTYNDIIQPGEPYYDEYSTNLSFVGLERTITLSDGNDYKVKVIDDGRAGSHTLADGGLFTFEFVDLFDSKVIFDTEPENYGLSNLNEYLKNTFIYTLPSVLQNKIKEVDKTIFNGHNASLEPQSTTIKAKLFPLSVSEYGLTNEGAYASEGNAYQYYANNLNSLVKKVNNTAVNYWTRSLDITMDLTSSSCAWAINDQGELGISNLSINPWNKLYVAPAFVI